MITQKELEKWRTVPEMRLFVDDTYNKIAQNHLIICNARLKARNGHFKEFIEEYYPLLHFTELFYTRQNVKVRYVGLKTQKNEIKYDGEIEINSGVIKRIEITAPINGKYEHKKAVQLNERGMTDVEIGDPNEKKKEIKEQIIKCAKRKSVKKYFNVILVIYFNFLQYIDMSEGVDVDFINEIVIELKNINYTSKEVYFLIPPYKSSSFIFGGAIHEVFTA